MKLSIALPGLLWNDSDDSEYISKQITTPKLDQLIRRSSISYIPYTFSDIVYSSYTTGTNSLARDMAKQLGHSSLYPNFLLAEPTFLRADRDRLLICESELLQLNDEEVSSIISSLNTHFSDILKFFPINSNLWLVGLNQEIQDNRFYPILDIIGKNIDDYLPGTKLTKILNEIQMLLFNLDLNKLRKNEGLIQINSLWLWDKEIKVGMLDNYSNIFTNSGCINGAKIESLPKSLDNAFIDNSLIIIDNLYYPCCYGDSYSYIHNLSVIDTQVMSLLLENLSKFDSLEILVPGTNNTLLITLNKNAKYKFWKNITLKQLMKEQHAC
ncbi:MAG: hypothetical protein K0R14_811 [Burkholderiales bacterium]|nr:hypothetical protein [Burkholderiales bacterium]